MRQLSDAEMRVLLKGAQDGILDLRTIPGYREGLPEFFYGECIRHDDGSITWEAKHLPIVSKTTWDRLCTRFKREPIVKLLKVDRAEIVKASIFGRIDESLLPQIYPLIPIARLSDVLYRNFPKEERKANEMPNMPNDWDGRFRGILEPAPGMEPIFMVIPHWDNDEDEDLNGRYEYQEEAEPFDYSTGEPLEDASMANFFDNISLGVMMMA